MMKPSESGPKMPIKRPPAFDPDTSGDDPL
jgi:hypothetical protein